MVSKKWRSRLLLWFERLFIVNISLALVSLLVGFIVYLVSPGTYKSIQFIVVDFVLIPLGFAWLSALSLGLLVEGGLFQPTPK